MLARTQLEISVRYSAPVTESRRTLRILPLHRAGQIVTREEVKVWPVAAASEVQLDGFGNRVLSLQHRQIAAEFRLTLDLETETSGEGVPDAQPNFVAWKMPSRAVGFSPELQEVARAAKELDPLERVAHFNRFCFLQLEYSRKTSANAPPSSLVWARKRGNCADFAHVFLSLCRCGGFAARYVGGFNASQGQMHAWAEVWCDGFWHAFDPTLGRAISPGGVAVAVGRDFYDCAPHQGTFRGAARAEIELRCRTQCES